MADVSLSLTCYGQADPASRAPADLPQYDIASAKVSYIEELNTLVFEMRLSSSVEGRVVSPRGQVDTAPVLAYVFPTDLQPQDVGFSPTEGVLALAITAHPDFDDTPLWDESLDGDYANDGAVLHPHWVVLGKDDRVAGGLSAVQFDPEKDKATLPPTHPGMPIYLDSPGFQIVVEGSTLKAIVPAFRVGGKIEFKYDAVCSYLEVNTSDASRPMLGVYKVYSLLSGDLGLPFRVERERLSN